jgi:hypothetical protein
MMDLKNFLALERCEAPACAGLHRLGIIANVGSSGVSTEMGAFGSDPNISPASRGTWSRWRTLNMGVLHNLHGADTDALRLATIDRASTSRLAPSNCRIKIGSEDKAWCLETRFASRAKVVPGHAYSHSPLNRLF